MDFLEEIKKHIWGLHRRLTGRESQGQEAAVAPQEKAASVWRIVPEPKLPRDLKYWGLGQGSPKSLHTWSYKQNQWLM